MTSVRIEMGVKNCTEYTPPAEVLELGRSALQKEQKVMANELKV